MTVRYPVARKLGFSLLLFCALIAPGCCVHAPAIKACERGIAGTKRYMTHPDSSEQTKDLATRCHDTYYQIEFGLGAIDKLPPGVQARKDARDAEGGGGE